MSDPATGTITVTTLTPQVIGVPATVDENSSIGLNLCATAPNGPVTFTTVGPNDGTIDQGLAAVNGPPCPNGYFNFGYERYTPTPLYSGPDLTGLPRLRRHQNLRPGFHRYHGQPGGGASSRHRPDRDRPRTPAGQRHPGGHLGPGIDAHLPGGRAAPRTGR